MIGAQILPPRDWRLRLRDRRDRPKPEQAKKKAAPEDAAWPVPKKGHRGPRTHKTDRAHETFTAKKFLLDTLLTGSVAGA